MNLVMLMAGLYIPLALGEPAVKFNTRFMQAFSSAGTGPALDLDAVSNAAGLGPGTYEVAVQLNQRFVERQSMTFTLHSDSGELEPCLSQPFLKALGVKLQAFSQPGKAPAACINLAREVRDASVQFDTGHMTLEISVPQIALRRDAEGYVAPEKWDRGINAAMLNYRFSGARTQSAQGAGSQYNLYASGGFNLGDWRVRSSSSFNRSAQGGSQWQRSASYAQRDLTALKSTLTLGESFTPGDVFDSLPIRGVQMASDMGMLPDSMQGYAPVIRGVAMTQAKVEVRQNGYSLYTTYVAPGAFVIDDLSTAGSSGDLEVVITEADGRVRRFIEPYASLGNMLREKSLRYGVSLGQYNAAYSEGHPLLGQATLAYGLPFELTAYGGVLGSDFYRATLAGMTKSLGSLGAISLDATQSLTDTPRHTRLQGQSYSLRYGKSFNSGTSLRFAGYRYSTQQYRSFAEALSEQSPARTRQATRRSRLEASINQSLDGYGSLYLTASQQTYWASSRQERQLSLGFNTHYKSLNIGVYASKSLSDSMGGDNQLSVTVSMPIGSGTSSASYNLNRNSDGTLDQRTSLSGYDGDLAYSVDGTRTDNRSASASALLGYRAPFAQLGGGVSVGQGYTQSSLSAAGSVLAHADGIVFGQTLGETVVLMDTQGMPNVGVLNTPGTLTNGQGYALMPYVTPYRVNRVAVDTSVLDPSVDIDQGVVNVVPRRGAVVKARFNATRTERVLLHVVMANGMTPPFGAHLADEQGHDAGVVGQAGDILLSAGSSKVFTLGWGDRAAQHCQVVLDIANAPVIEGYRIIDAVCAAPHP